MPSLNVSYEQMIHEANAVQAGREQVVQQLQALRVRIENLVTRGFVSDSASRAFNHTYEQFLSGSTEAVDALDAIATALTNVASTLQQADQTLGQQFGP